MLFIDFDDFDEIILSTCCLILGFVIYHIIGDQPEDVEEQVRIFTLHFFYFHVFSSTFTCSYFSHSLNNNFHFDLSSDSHDVLRIHLQS